MGQGKAGRPGLGVSFPQENEGAFGKGAETNRRLTYFLKGSKLRLTRRLLVQECATEGCPGGTETNCHKL